MQDAMLVVWTIGLLVALAATVVVLKRVVLVVRTITAIRRLAALTLTASQGLERNLRAAALLDELQAPLGALPATVARLRPDADAIARTLDRLGS